MAAEPDPVDAVQFLRYARVATQAGARVTLACGPDLRPLVCPGDVAAVVALDGELPECDFVTYLMSAPIGFRTGAESVPAATPYLCAGDGHATGERRAGAGLHVGVSTAGLPSGAPDLMRLGERLPGATLVDLDAGPAPGAADPGGGVAALAARVRDVDVVVAGDGLAAHLAGALGKPGTVLTPAPPTWRWGTRDGRAVWYPSLRVEPLGDAPDASVLERVAQTIGT